MYMLQLHALLTLQTTNLFPKVIKIAASINWGRIRTTFVSSHFVMLNKVWRKRRRKMKFNKLDKLNEETNIRLCAEIRRNLTNVVYRQIPSLHPRE
jgi:hypothetical protein